LPEVSHSHTLVHGGAHANTDPTTSPLNGNVVYVYDGDGNLVKSVIGDVVTYYPNGVYELKVNGSNEIITKYYSAGSSRIAYRINVAITWQSPYCAIIDNSRNSR
jgi:hypothetical protein